MSNPPLKTTTLATLSSNSISNGFKSTLLKHSNCFLSKIKRFCYPTQVSHSSIRCKFWPNWMSTGETTSGSAKIRILMLIKCFKRKLITSKSKLLNGPKQIWLNWVTELWMGYLSTSLTLSWKSASTLDQINWSSLKSIST